MKLLRVNPTRMELTRLKKRLKVAVKGHKLLKDKCDEMVRRFMEIIRENRVLRRDMEQKLSDAQREFAIAGMYAQPDGLELAFLAPVRQISVLAERQNIMGVVVPKLSQSEESGSETEFLPYGMLETPAGMDAAVSKLSDVFPVMLRLAEVEKTCSMLADEIEKTRRRVNALEYVLIPQLKDTIKYITMKLDENERGNLVRLIKFKAKG